jgi:ferredoxin
MNGSTSVTRLAVDWFRCDGRGLCAELLPEHIRLDDWGYPIVDGDVDRSSAKAARRAVTACPTLALRLESRPASPVGQPSPPGRGTPRRR